VYLDSSLTLKEHHRTRMRKARQAAPSHRSVWADTKPLPKNPGRVRQSKCPLCSELWWANGRGVKGQANDIQLVVNRQSRSTTGCYKSTNTSALVAEAASLRPATSLLDNRQPRFALSLAGLPSSGQASCVVGAKDAPGQQLERANGSNHPDDHRRPPLRRSHHRRHRCCGYQDG